MAKGNCVVMAIEDGCVRGQDVGSLGKSFWSWDIVRFDV